MFAQIATVIGEAALICEVLLGAALLLLWLAIEVIGYAGLAIAIARRQRWLMLTSRPQPARDIKWGATVRAAGMRSQRLQARRPQAA
jgi:hypothetical protein